MTKQCGYQSRFRCPCEARMYVEENGIIFYACSKSHLPPHKILSANPKDRFRVETKIIKESQNDE